MNAFESALSAWGEDAAALTSLIQVPGTPARFAKPSAAILPQAQSRLEELGLTTLYGHQAEAYDAFQQGRDLLVTTGTSSGKSMCYNLPILQSCLSEPRAKALLLFPTKALAQDQAGKLQALFDKTHLRCATYDADTPKSNRSAIRNDAAAILTNPDMLHMGILPNGDNWIKFFKSLRIIVLDELHQYRGIFGCHVAWIVRRLLRLCEWHGCRPQIIATSATIGNPSDLFFDLTGRRAQIISQNDAPASDRIFGFWTTMQAENRPSQSPNWMAADLMVTLAQHGLQCLTFSRSRVGAELVLRYARQLAEERNLDPVKFDSYRGGYTPKERRAIEQALFKGKLLGLSSTNALELGVDVGSLDAVVMNGYPGSIASFWQQAGRAGRGKKPGMAMMIAHEDPLEQFLLREPERLLGGKSESICVNPGNPDCMRVELRCAAFEKALRPHELGEWGYRSMELAEQLDQAGELRFQAGQFFYPGFTSPASEVNIRGTGGGKIELQIGQESLGFMERWRAYQTVHDGAIYLHRGQSYKVQKLDLAQSTAFLVANEANYYTQANVQSLIEVQGILAEQSATSYVFATVTDTTTGFTAKSFEGQESLGFQELDLPSESYDTFAVRFDFPMPGDEDVEPFMSALHGMEHALIGLAPLFAGCDRTDLGSAWFMLSPDTFAPSLFIFDRIPGGVGLAAKLFETREIWLKAALELLTTCTCEGGCPACILSSRCESNNEKLSKEGAIALLKETLSKI